MKFDWIKCKISNFAKLDEHNSEGGYSTEDTVFEVNRLCVLGIAFFKSKGIEIDICEDMYDEAILKCPEGCAKYIGELNDFIKDKIDSYTFTFSDATEEYKDAELNLRILMLTGLSEDLKKYGVDSRYYDIIC